MTNKEVSSLDYANSMIEHVETLIVKVGRKLESKSQIPGLSIN